MKPINFFGKKIFIKIEENKDENHNSKQSSKEKNINVRMIVLLMLIIFFVLSSKLAYVEAVYKEGTVLQKDIVATNSISYIDNDKKRELIDKLISEVDVVYIVYEKIEEEVYDKVNDFFKDLKNASSGKNYEEYLQRLELKLNEDDLKRILKPKDIDKVKKEILTSIEEIYKRGLRDNTEDINIALEEVKVSGDNLKFQIISRFLKPNQLYNYERTEAELKKKIANIGDIRVNISAGDIVLRAGQKISQSDIELLKKIGVFSLVDNARIFVGNLLYLLVISGLFWITMKKLFSKYILNKKHYYATMLAILILFLGVRFVNLRYISIIPFEFLTVILGILFGPLYSGVVSSFVFMYVISLVGYNSTIFLVILVSMVFAIYSTNRIKTRTDIVNIGIYIGLLKMLIGIAIAWINKLDFVYMVFSMAQLFLSGILTGMIVIALLPYFENSFNILTKMKLIELGDLSHPLLKRMSLEAPGTFHHSMLVATLSEQAAEAIGADSIFTRVACYYHDIGKMKRPNFYVENQKDGINPHDKLSPNLSTLIIKAHTKDGQEMGKEYKIPKEIRDIMAEHQGTTFLAYFYNRAKKEDPTVEASDFRYDGPKPKTKESAVIMLADSIEAAVRTLDEKDPISIEKMIRRRINAKIEDDQLSDADLTLKEIDTIVMTFVKVLGGIYHSRIKYPDQKK